MIFAHTFDLVMDGRKSQTRRIPKIKEQHIVTESRSYVEIPGERIVYQVGKSYAVQPGRGKNSIARILLTNIKSEIVSAISDADVIAEGFESRDAFIQTWCAIHGRKSNLSQTVWVLEFILETTVSVQNSHAVPFLLDSSDKENANRNVNEVWSLPNDKGCQPKAGLSEAILSHLAEVAIL